MKIIILTSNKETDHEFVFEILHPIDLGALMVALPGLAEQDIDYTTETVHLDLN